MSARLDRASSDASIGNAAMIPRPPVAKRQPKVREIHGQRRVDDYSWLHDRDDPDVVAYLEAENAHARAAMRPTEALQQKLYEEMLARIQETDMEVPWRKGDYFYYSRTEKDKQYPIYCRRPGSLEGPEQVLLDVNTLAEGEAFLALGVFAVSDDGTLLAYSTDNGGSQNYTLAVKDLRTGSCVLSGLEHVTTVAWAKDNRTLFYVVENEETKRSWRVHRHRVGTRSHDVVFEELDEAFYLGLSRTRDGEFVVLSLNSFTTSEVRVLPAELEGEWRLVAERIQGQQYDIDHRDGLFWIRTNDRGANFRVVTAPVLDPRRQNWSELVAHRPDVMIEAVELFRNHVIVFERENGLSELVVIDLRTMESHRIAFPEPAYTVAPDRNEDWDAASYRYTYESFITPLSVFDYDVERRTATLLKEQPVPGYDRTRYTVERIYANASDGVRIPISVGYRNDLVRDGLAPIYLSGYGAYGAPSSVAFGSECFSLVDRGVVVAVAHVRGGGELGKQWHDDGRLLRKRNTFTDFIAAAEHLVARKYGARERLAIQGFSAGGLLAGAVSQMRPDLFRAVVANSPFLDVLNSLTDPDHDEWGDPNKKEEYEYIRSYCPYSNLEEQKAYPALLITASFNDSQVMYWQPAKYVAKLRALKADSNLVMLKTNMAARHHGASGRYDSLRELAFDYAFVLWQTGSLPDR
jgi:oligopeptidase B